MGSVINKLMLGGVRLISNAVLRFTRNGKPYTRFTVEVEDGWRDRRKSYLLNCILWGENAQQLAPLLIRNCSVTLEGRLSFNRWQGNDGRVYNNPEMVVQTILLPQRKPTPPPRPAIQRRPVFPTAGTAALKPAVIPADELPPF